MLQVECHPTTKQRTEENSQNSFTHRPHLSFIHHRPLMEDASTTWSRSTAHHQDLMWDRGGGVKPYRSLSHDAALSQPQPQTRIHLVLLEGLQETVERRLRLSTVEQLHAEVVQYFTVSTHTHIWQDNRRQQVHLRLLWITST